MHLLLEFNILIGVKIVHEQLKNQTRPIDYHTFNYYSGYLSIDIIKYIIKCNNCEIDLKTN